MEQVLFFDAHTHHPAQGPGECRVISIDAGSDAERPSPGRLFTAGLHPWYLYADTQQFWNKLLFLASSPDCVGIGECGLDALRGDLRLQEFWFRKQVALAGQLNKPLVLHVVRAHEEARTILRAERFQGAVYIHGFRGNWAAAEPWLKMGAYLGISPAALKKPIPAFFQNIDKTKILSESDDSDWSLETIFAETASCLNMSAQAWKEQGMKNAKLFYHV